MPETRADILRFDRLFKSPLLHPDHRQIIWIHYTLRGPAKTRQAHLKLTKTRYFDRLADAKRQIDHFMSQSEIRA